MHLAGTLAVASCEKHVTYELSSGSSRTISVVDASSTWRSNSRRETASRTTPDVLPVAVKRKLYRDDTYTTEEKFQICD